MSASSEKSSVENSMSLGCVAMVLLGLGSVAAALAGTYGVMWLLGW